MWSRLRFQEILAQQGLLDCSSSVPVGWLLPTDKCKSLAKLSRRDSFTQTFHFLALCLNFWDYVVCLPVEGKLVNGNGCKYLKIMLHNGNTCLGLAPPGSPLKRQRTRYNNTSYLSPQETHFFYGCSSSCIILLHNSFCRHALCNRVMPEQDRQIANWIVKVQTTIGMSSVNKSPLIRKSKAVSK